MVLLHNGLAAAKERQGVQQGGCQWIQGKRWGLGSGAQSSVAKVLTAFRTHYRNRPTELINAVESTGERESKRRSKFLHKQPSGLCCHFPRQGAKKKPDEVDGRGLRVLVSPISNVTGACQVGHWALESEGQEN